MPKNYPDEAGACNDNETQVLLALQTLGGNPTVRQVALCADLPITVTHSALMWLRAQGLVDWRPGASRTLHATVRPAALPPYNWRRARSDTRTAP